MAIAPAIAPAMQALTAGATLASGAIALGQKGPAGQVLKPHEGPGIPMPPQGFAVQAPQLLQAPRHQDLLSILNQYRS